MKRSLLNAPRIALLGVAERAGYVREGHPVMWRHNLLGVRLTLVNYFYPCAARGWNIVLGVYDPSSIGKVWVRLVDEAGEQLFRIDLTFETKYDEPIGEGSGQRAWRLADRDIPNWILFHQPLTDLIVKAPGAIRVLVGSESQKREVCIGCIQCLQAMPPPLTEDRKAAIRADPRAGKLVRAVLGCKQCQSKLYVIAGVDRPSDIDGETKIWYEDAPNSWTCQCGATTVPLESMRTSLHGILGRRGQMFETESELSFIKMYERGALADVCEEFGALLDKDPLEQDVQSFLEANTVFLHRFSPTRIKSKAPILTKHQTDFTILDSRGILVLVEIERPSLPLLRKNGEMTQKLQHAFEQVRAWLDVSRRRWTAVLDCMDIPEAEVAGCRGAVIAGRDKSYPTEHLMRLKGADHGGIDYFTYDDLLEDTIKLSRDLG